MALPQRFEVDGKPVTLRWLNAGDPEEDARYRTFIASLAPEHLRFRFGGRIASPEDPTIERVAHVDPDRERTLVATVPSSPTSSEIIGEVRLLDDPDRTSAEFAIAVRSDIQRCGLGRALLKAAIDDCRARGMQTLYGLVDSSNHAMLALARRLGFVIDPVPDSTTVVVSLRL